jgi:hypothetical protein
MVKPFKKILKQTGDYCTYCFLYDDCKNQREDYKILVLKNLEMLIRLYDEDSNKQILKETLNKCKNCDYKNPYVFQFLETKDFKIF